MAVTYLHLPSGAAPPPGQDLRPFRAMLVIEQEVTDAWRELVSHWLVHVGCFYMLAWGLGCGKWHDSVDWANLEATNFEVSDDNLIMTTSHESEPLAEAFWFAGFCAHHPIKPLDNTLIIDISGTERETAVLAAWEAAQREI